MAASDWEDEWELCNDDGFVYKRKKRRLDHHPATSAPPPPPPDPHAEERHRRERKKRTLLKLRDKYQREIHQWEYLSNSLRAMEERSQQQQQQQQREQEQPESSLSALASPSAVRSQELACRSLVDELLFQAEAQEAIIRDVSNLCDVAESMCNAQEDRLKQSFIDLPIWASPRELMASLCDE